jgi:hypothetical protein
MVSELKEIVMENTMKRILIIFVGLFIFTGVLITANESMAATAFFSPKTPPETSYTIDCKIDKDGTFHEHLRVTIDNTTGKQLEKLAFDWVKDDKRIYSVSLKGKQLNPLPGYGKRTEEPVLFQLPAAINPGGQAVLDVEATYRFQLQDALKNNTNAPVLGWHPKLWWGYSTHSSYDVKLDVPGEYVITTSGRFDAKTGRWKGENIRSFVVVIGKDLDVLEGMAGDVLVRVLYPRHEKAKKCAPLLMTTAKDVINFYRERFGFYPNQVLSIIPGYTRPWGGYPVATNVVAIHGIQAYPERGELHWKWITAHEIGHQYFIEHVLEKTSHYWLVIGLGIYADREWMYARNLGNEKHENFINRYVKGTNQRYDTRAVIHEDEREIIDFDYNNVVHHGKGYSIIAALEFVLGKPTFNRIYKRLLKEFKGRELGTHDFQAVCEAESGQNLEWFFSQWVFSSRFMSWEVVSKNCVKTAKAGGGYISNVVVKNSGTLEIPVPVRAYFTDNTSQEQRTERFLDVTELIFKSSTPLKEVKIDPDGILANVVPVPEMGVRDLMRAVRKLAWTGDGDRALKLFEHAIRLKLNRSRDWSKLALTLYDGKHYKEALNALQQVDKYVEESSTWKMAVWVWQGHIYDLIGKRDKALTCYKEALKYEKGQRMTHSQYNMLLDRKWIEERLKTPFKRR